MLHELILGSWPLSWAALSLCVWVSYVFAQGVGNMGRWDRHHLIWGFLSVVHFMYYVLVIDQSFQVRFPDMCAKEKIIREICFWQLLHNTAIFAVTVSKCPRFRSLGMLVGHYPSEGMNRRRAGEMYTISVEKTCASALANLSGILLAGARR